MLWLARRIRCHRAAGGKKGLVQRKRLQPQLIAQGVDVGGKFIQRRDGYSYFVAKLTLVPGQKLGLAIKHYQNRVLVSKAEPGSVAGVELQVRGGEGGGNSQVGDHLVDVNAVPVTDKDVARGLLIKALQARPSPSLRTCSKAAT